MRIPLLLPPDGAPPPAPGATAGPASGVDAPRVLAPRVLALGPLSDGLVDRDLDAVLPARPDAVLLRGAVGARDLQHLGAKLAVREAELRLPAGHIGILAAAADTPAGVLALAGLAGASPRLRALVWDGVPLARALGLADPAAGPLLRARDLLVLAAAAAGVPALVLPQTGRALVDTCAAAARDGFAGVVARGPGEVAVIARWFPAGAP